MIKALFHASIMCLCFTGPVFANSELLIENFVGRISIKTTSSSVITVKGDGNMTNVKLIEDDKYLKIDGGIPKPNSKDCKTFHGSLSIDLFGIKI